MISLYLDGVSMRSVSPRIVLHEVTETKPNTTINAVTMGHGIGQRVTQRSRNYLEFGVKFAIDIQRGHEAERMQIINAINTWAHEGRKMSLSYRPGMFADVMLAEPVNINNIKKWNEDMTLVFRAYGVPYWQESASADSTVGTCTSGDGRVQNPGNAEAPLYFSVTNMSGETVNRVSIECDGQSMDFVGIGLDAGKTLGMEYKNGVMYAAINGRSVMMQRTPDSYDDIMIQPGEHPVHVSSDNDCSWVLHVRGRWI